MKKFISVLFAVLVLSFCFTGCTNSGKNEISKGEAASKETIDSSSKVSTDSEAPEIVPLHAIKGAIEYNLKYGTDTLQYDEITSIRNYWKIPTSPEAFPKFSPGIYLVLLYDENISNNKGEMIGSAIILNEDAESFFEEYSILSVNQDNVTVSIFHAFEISDSGELIPLGVNIEQNKTKDFYYVEELVFDVSSDYREDVYKRQQ